MKGGRAESADDRFFFVKVLELLYIGGRVGRLTCLSLESAWVSGRLVMAPLLGLHTSTEYIYKKKEISTPSCHSSDGIFLGGVGG